MAWVTCRGRSGGKKIASLPEKSSEEAEPGSAPPLQPSLAAGCGHGNLGTYVAKIAQGLEN